MNNKLVTARDPEDESDGYDDDDD